MGQQDNGAGLLGAIKSWVGGRKREAAPEQAAPPAPAASDRAMAPWEPGAPDATTSWFAPQCPQCKSPMLLRAHDEGTQAGRKYWACSKEGCQGVREMQAG